MIHPKTVSSTEYFFTLLLSKEAFLVNHLYHSYVFKGVLDNMM
jgi:hypothetical protein